MKSFSIFILLSQICISQVIHKKSFDRFTHYEPDDWITYAYSNHITSVDVGVEFIYFGTSKGGILRYNFFDEKWGFPQTTSNGLSSNKIIRVVYDHLTNQLYALTSKGVDVFNRAFEYWQPAQSEIPSRKGPEFINNNPGNSRYPQFSRPGVNKWPSFFSNDNYELMLDGIIYNPDNDEYKVTDKVVGPYNKMWIGTNGTGAGIADMDMLQLRFIKQSIPAIRVKDVLVKDDNIWMAGSSFKQSERGITSWNLKENSWTYFKSGINYNIFSDEIGVIAGIESQIFFGTEQGLLQYSSKKGTWISLQRKLPLKNDAIFDLSIMNNFLYIASENGAFKYDYKNVSVERIGKKFFHQTPVNKIACSSQDVYLATNRGIYKYNPTTDETHYLNSQAAIDNNFIKAIAVNNDTLWFASQYGIGFYDIKNDAWKSYPATSLRLNATVNDIAFTQWYTWFATSNGLLKFDIDRDYWYLYTAEDGLADNRISNIDVDDDILWLSTFGGVTKFRWYREGRFE